MCLTLLFLLNTLGLGLGVHHGRHPAGHDVLDLRADGADDLPSSGLYFPIENMPWLFQVGSLRHSRALLRDHPSGIFLKGSGLEVLWPEALTPALTGLAWLTFASARFRKRLD